jgi:hypothetical protein
MATVNIGNIKFNWKGPWSNSTTYAVDDVVSLSGSSYISIQAGSNQNPASASAYWQQMSAAGTNGTDGTNLATTLTTRGDIVFKGASALTRLPKGTAGYFLKQGANDPEWGEAGGGLVQTATNVKTDTYSSTTTGSWNDVDGVHVSLTNVGATSHKAIGNIGFAWGTNSADTVSNFRIRKTIDDGSNWTVLHEHGSSSGGAGTFRGQTVGLRSMLDTNGGNYTNLPFFDTTIGTTGTVKYQLQQRRTQSGTFYLNRTHSDSTTYGRGSTNLWVMEVKV